jgi:hypothetical protein
MHKNKIIGVIIALIILSIGAYFYFKQPIISIGNSLKITAMPSPPKITTITNKQKIKEFEDLINSIHKSPILFYGGKGWEYLFSYDDTSLCIDGEKMEIGWRWYSVDKNTVKKIDKFYKTIK